MPKSEVLLYSHSKFNAIAVLYKLAIYKGKIYGIVLYEIAILLTCFMKEYFNSFDDVQFFHTFSSISQDMWIVMLSKIHHYIQNFILYKMIYFLSHKFVFSHLHFLSFYKHFSQLCKICIQIKNKVYHINQLKEPDLMIYTHMPFSKKTTPLHLPIQNIFLTVNPFYCFFAKSLRARNKN